MELRIDHQRIAGICYVTFRPIFTATEKDKVKRFSSPEVETGGDFGDFTLPLLTKKIYAFPFTQAFDGLTLGHEDAAARAATYEAEMLTRIETSWDTFMELADTFQGESVTII